MWAWLHRWGSPPVFFSMAGRVLPWLVAVGLGSGLYGLCAALWLSPADYQQGEAVRIMYVHVPSAFCSLLVYTVMAVAALCSLIWRLKLADVVLQVSAPLGAGFTLLALLTGALWGRPMWGTWWIWDARLSAELILLFLYIGVMGLAAAFTDRQARARACAILVVVGAVDIPIIHYSVYWWNTLHQGATLRLLGDSPIAASMLHPLLAMLLAFVCYYGVELLLRVRAELLRREVGSQWVKEFYVCGRK